MWSQHKFKAACMMWAIHKESDTSLTVEKTVYTKDGPMLILHTEHADSKGVSDPQHFADALRDYEWRIVNPGYGAQHTLECAKRFGMVK